MAQKARHSGFAALIGQPNVGKSTLLNRMTGEKLAIVSAKPQTTRNRILGVVTRPEGQVAFVDTPGIHKARGELNKYMVEVALSAASEVDIVVFIIEFDPSAGDKQKVSAEDRDILERIGRSNRKTLLAINKVDLGSQHLLLPLIDVYRTEFPFLEVVPVSARTGDGVDLLFKTVLQHLPEGEPLFPEDMLTDQAERFLVAEYIREQVLKHCRQEVPYSTAVRVEIFDESDREPKAGQKKKKGALAGLIRIDASIFVERDSQKAIIIGKRGAMLKTIGTDARRSIERLLGTHVYLSLRVRVEPRWSERPDALRKLGYE